MSGVCFVDTETTGLDPDRHEIWEVGLITPDGQERHWFLPVDLGRADPIALNIGRYHERCHSGVTDPGAFASGFAHLTWGHHLAGAVVSFDAERLAKLLRANGQCPGWHYHLIDVEALAVGYLAGQADAGSECRPGVDDEEQIGAKYRALVAPPWKSDQLTEALGIHVDDMDKHTALGDARWAKAIYEAVIKSKVED